MRGPIPPTRAAGFLHSNAFMPPLATRSDPTTLLPAPRAARRAVRRLLCAGACSVLAAPAIGELQRDLAAEHDTMSVPRAVSAQPLPGLEINYDLLADPGAARGRGRLRGAMAVPLGNLATSVLVNPGGAAGERLARLDTRWQATLPDPVQTLVIGDTWGGGTWSDPVRFGGVRMGRAPMPLPGQADAAPGEAAASTLPTPAPLLALSGGNERSLAAARELLGAPPAAPAGAGVLAPLAAGASDYALEAGRLRTGWGTPDDQYADPYAAAAYRHGLGLALTAEGRAEWTPSRAATSLELSRDFGAGAAARALIAQSVASGVATPALQGLRRGLSLEGRLAEAGWTLAWDGFDRDYTPLASLPGEAEARARLRAGTTLALWNGATATARYAHESRWDGGRESSVGLHARVPLAEGTRLDLSYTQRQGPQPGWQALLKLSVPLEFAPGP